ncbi:MAG: undecaprenyl-diphosphate phosphatase [Patescibacteria group bacterium]
MNTGLLILSVLEGLTEFLPVSSTAHLIIVSKILQIDTAEPYIKFFLLFIQLGALLAGIILFSRKVLTDKKLLTNLCISFIPSAVIGFIFYKLFKLLLEGNMILLGAMLALCGAIFIYLEKGYMKNHCGPEGFGTTEISKKDALIIGLAQAIAIIPGVSRSGATIVAGILRGIRKATIIEYTFLLALPTLGAAVAYDTFKSRDLLMHLNSFGNLISGFLLSFVTALATLYILKKYLPKISLTGFGYYRLALALIVFLFVL